MTNTPQKADEEIAVCTAVSKNYLAYARVLSKSLREQHSSVRIFVLLVDRLEGAFDPKKEPFDLIEIEELDNIPEPKNFFFKYKPIELNTAAKPYLFEYLFRKYGLRKLIFLDPDILVLDPLTTIWNLLDPNNIVLTPHITEPYRDNRHPDEKHLLQSGIFNLGFIAMANTPATAEFLTWWQERLYEFCFMDIAQGMHVDQNWVNFAPVMFDGIHILKDPAYNIAYWNLHYRGLALNFDQGKWTIQGTPVVFFHFSGFETDDIEKISKHQDRFRLRDLPHLRPLFEHYRNLLLENEHQNIVKWKYAYDYFDNGVRITEFIRNVYNHLTRAGYSFENPFATKQAESFFRWLNKGIDAEQSSADLLITNLMAFIYSNRIDIRFVYQKPLDRDRRAFIQWFRTFGKRECQLDDALIPGSERFAVVSSPPLTGVGARQVVSASEGRTEGRPLPSGINVAGYFNGEFGVAEAARDSVRALQTTQIPFVLNNIMAPGHRHHDLSFKEFSPDNPYFVNLIHVNADQAKVFRDLKGESYFKGRYNIGVWFWELEDFPKKWLSSFQYYDEIWAKSEFCRQAFAKVSPVPVVRIKNPIILDEKTIKPDRSKFSLSQKEFVFLFLFDYASVFERKNPLGTISAFQKAFSKNDNVRLLIKSINSQQAPDKVALLQATAGDHKISFIDRHLDPAHMLSLLASADCFVSLHRSEGFGLGMAQSMYLGKPVIATCYSGNMDFMNAQNSFLVDYKLIELQKDYGPYEKGNVWAEPDIDHATELMRLVYNDRALAEKRAQQAAWDIRMEFSPQVVGAEMQARVHQIYQGQTPSFQKTTEVSIIIPAFNRIDLTRQCLNAIPQTAGDIPYEIIVVDNGSTDCTSDYLRQEQAAGRLQAIINSGNLGFARACNQGAKTARGRYLLFLNNDTLPHPGWLEEMVNLAESDKDIGIVGSKLLFPDGTIQHAGVVVSSNKLPYHIYRGLPGNLPCANKQRDYQIVTAACMLIKKDLFLKVGAFDERFVNGCEDLDLCLKVRQEHKRVVYNPKSVLTHFEAQTEGRQDKMDFNRRLFLSIWQDKIQQDDRHFLEQDGMALQIGPDGSFRFIPSDKPGTPVTEPPSLKPSIIIVTFNSAKTIRACIDSVLRYTPNAEVIVVDNASADKTQSILNEYKGRITTILNNENKGFSFACNQGIRASKGEYVILLNPDTVVTPMWAERMLAHFKPDVGAVGPLTNYTTSTQLSSVYAKDLRNWETLKTNERAEKLYEWNKGQGKETKLLVGFCLALPRRVLDEAGLLDEELFLGSEDLEISWRLRQRGYKLIIATDTFIYHEGQVSFKSVEKRPSTKESDQKLYEKLVAHYGEGNVPHPMEIWGVDYFRPEGARFRSPSLNEGEYDVHKISPNPIVPKRGTFAAVYCVYDDTTWLRESIESVYDAVDALYFLISDRPWFGQATDNKTTLEYIRTFPDPLHKIKVIEGTWTNETEQRNKGLDIVKEAGIAYCFVIDADEIYNPMELKHMMELAVSRPEIDCWHITLDTYWKSYRYRIEPREPLTPPVFIKIKDARFAQNRLAKCNNPGLIPPETGICHHLSYARSDAEVLKKITTFSHAHEVNPGWFEKVWKRWDANHLLTDLHPTHPHNYQRAVEQPFSGLPPVLKKRYLSDEIETTGGAVIAGLTSIIILAHNQWSQTERCLESIRRHTPEPHEIIVVDNNSTDETRERLREMVNSQGSRGQGFKDSSEIQQGSIRQDSRIQGFKDSSEIQKEKHWSTGPLESLDPVVQSSNPVFKVIINNTNRGYAAGNNQGISIARGEYLLLLNNDTVVTPGWLGRMTGIFKRYPKTGVAGPISNNVTRPQLAENVDYDKVGGIDGFAEKWAKEHEGQSFTTTKASGFCLLTRREVIDTIGGLDEQFGSGNFEDDDFCSRAFLTGFEIRIVQDVFIHHEGSQTFKGAGIDYNAKMMRNWELYKAKWDIPKDTPLDRYWVPSRIPETVSHFFPLPDLSFDHNVDPENRWWEDFRKKEEQGEEKVMKKERSKGLTSLIVLLSGHSGYARTCVESIQRHTKEPHEILFVPMEASYTPLKWLRKMLKENKNYKLLQDSRGQGFEDSSAIQKTKSSTTGILESSNPASLSFAQACNRGLVEAKGEYLAILRDTLVVTEGWLSGMREHLNSSSGTGIVGPMTVNVEGRQKVTIQDSRIQGFEDSSAIQQDSRGQGFEDSSEIRKAKRSDPGILDSLDPAVQAFAKSFRERNRYRRVPVKTLDSFCLLFTHTLTDKVGLFDERFETDEYAGDDYCIRAAVEGCQNLIAGDVFIHYYGLQPLPTLKDRIAFGKKWGDAGEAKPESQGVYCANALLLSDELSQKGQKEQAVVTLVEGIKLYPDERRLRYALAETLIEVMKYNEALDLLEALPGEFKGDEKRLELMGSCKIYLGQGEDADRYADELLLLNNASPKAWNLKGTVAFQKKSYADAERFFQKAIESDRGFGEAYANIGALRWADSKKEEALQLFEKAFILSPTAEDIVTNYYTAVVALSQLPAAEKTFREAIALYPFNRRLEFILIDNLLQQGKYPEAMDEMEKALAIFGVDDDTLAVALKLREQIQQESKRQDSRGQRGKDSSEIQKIKHSTPGTLESLNPVSFESSNPRTLSLCMIVKNEEKNIMRALQGVKPLVDEMIVVDTGSTDRTKKIATAFGAKVYDFQWTDSFSDARNFSLSKATGDWILVLDADEVISAQDYGKLRELIRKDSRGQGFKDSSVIKKSVIARSEATKQSQGPGKDEIAALPPVARNDEYTASAPPVQPAAPGILESLTPVSYSFITRNYVGPVSANWHPNEGIYKEEAGSGWFPSGKVRLFPNDSHIRFEKPVHEVVEDSLLRAGYEIVKSDIPIHHYGKLNTEEIRAKGEEYFQLGKKKLAEQGAENPKALYELAVQASELEKYDEALEFWKRLIAVKPDFGNAYYGMGTSYYKLARYGEARDAYRKAVEITPGSKDPVVMYATSELIAGDADAAVSLLDGLLRKNPGYPLALLAAAAAYLCAGRKKEGLEYIHKVGQTQFGLAPYLSDIAKLLISVKRFDYAVRLLETAVETGNSTGETRQLLEDMPQDSRILASGESPGRQGFKDASEPLKKKVLTPQPHRFSTPVSSPGTLESSNPRTLSLCMIVKNEEETIERALLSVKPVVDEMIVVDTGSTDRTKDIARSLGAKVFDFDWTNNFSDARNFSLSKASGKWILVLDADEVISPADHDKLKQLIRKDPRIQGFEDSSEIQKSVIARSEATKQSQGPGKDKIAALPPVARNDEHTASAPAVQPFGPAFLAYSFVTRNYTSSASIVGWLPNDGSYPSEEAGTGWFGSEKVRLFPHDSRIRFERPVHETVENSLFRLGIEIKKCDVPVHHYGKLDRGKIVAKGEEYYELGKRKLIEKGGNDATAIFELALQASELEKYEESLAYWKRLAALKPGFAAAFYYMGITYHHLGRYEDALYSLKEAMKLTPDSTDIMTDSGKSLTAGLKDIVPVYAKYEIIAGDAGNAVFYLIGLLQKFPSDAKAMAALATAYFCKGRKKEGSVYTGKLREMSIGCAEYFSEIARILISVNRLDYAGALLEAAVETGETNDATQPLLDTCRKLQKDSSATQQDSKREGSRIQGFKDSSATQQDSRGRGFEDSSEIQKTKYSTPGTLESSNPRTLSSGTLESLNPSLATRTLESSNPRTLSSGALSLCMIVKNEEETIERALLSVKPVVDEMIVVDTGSTDRTKDIATALGAKVYDIPWTDNFSDARNFSLSKATGDWILILDADEVISALDYGKLKQLISKDSRIQGVKDSSGIQQGSRGQGFEDSSEIQKTKYTTTGTLDSLNPVVQHSAPGILEPLNPVSYSFVTRTYVTEMNTAGWVGNDGSYPAEEAGTGWFPGEKVRLFPNDRRIRFEYPIHERVEPSLIKAGIEIRTCDIPIHHYGNFVTLEKARSKAERYYQLGQKKIAESGQQNFMAFYEIALQGAELGKHEEAIQYLKKAVALRPDFAKAHQSMGNMYYNLGRYAEALLCYRKAFELDPGARDAVMMCATCEIYAGNAEKAVALLEELPAGEASSPQQMLLLAEAYVCAGRKEKGLEYVKKLRALKLDSGRLLNNFAKILISTSRRDYALSILDAAVEAGVATDETGRLREQARER